MMKAKITDQKEVREMFKKLFKENATKIYIEMETAPTIREVRPGLWDIYDGIHHIHPEVKPEDEKQKEDLINEIHEYLNKIRDDHS